MYAKDTIAAISTPIGEGGIGIVRISGSHARQIAEQVFRRNRNGGWYSHRFYYGTVLDPVSGEHIDEALVVWMQEPRSYTGEHVVEIQCHGGYLVVQRILSIVVRQGARLADPGEFTRRAFLNGRLDLIQAEAVIDVIRSKTDAALALAQRQREGVLSRRIEEAREGILHSLALAEAFIDFPEEDLDDASYAEMGQSAGKSLAILRQLLDGFDEGKVLREGVSVLIIGKPNVGKSSLLNALLKEKRAIVTSVPGTTRDIIEEIVNINGLPVRLVDTAGIRDSDDQVERLGIDLALERIPQADLVIFLLDSSRPFDTDDRLLLDRLEGIRYIVVCNKKDLPSQLHLPQDVAAAETVSISASDGDGIEDLKKAIYRAFIQGTVTDSRESVAISHARHRDALRKGVESLVAFQTGLASGNELELLAVDLRDSLHAVGEVTGETTPDEVLDLIFTRFCIGK
ncbi:tRNA uridine-5-carboxymethylaminomethyl(34) synthesis GTPase MnmE [Geobacter sp. DSM 9736]|uniref:tRNA uridine-5-carboxymethylaminomethyl(34) synthesis GTPase MnmE n=1 Tax=Geobacter sp. DSM 9736 TaxID=1277350 RepID=UPI000B4FFED8|nr:tRNA uridine-5-carboxymethylaminomethyl(34) synthesis GTPase MnmE [Geobacter sp. DSM 9736]SNB47289.1 tRNA modification GTPase trmE [Geobacter sp. DSM 9736]